MKQNHYTRGDDAQDVLYESGPIMAGSQVRALNPGGIVREGILTEYNNNALDTYRSMCRFAEDETERSNKAERQLDLIASLFRGLAQSERGETVDLGDFAQYL